MRHAYYISDVFTDRPLGGNPLAVFPDGHLVPPELMPRIARELNLSETVFVLPAEHAAHHSRLRIFTPARELPFAGHPTVGTACTLLSIGRLPAGEGRTRITLEEGVGPIPVEVHSEEGRTFATFTARLPELGPAAPPREALAEMLSLATEDILAGELRPGTASSGVPYLFVPVVDRAALARIRLNSAVFERVLSGFWADHVFVLAEDPELPGSSLRARMFAPLSGVPEDPATGSAAAALPGYLAQRETPRAAMLRWRIEQGFEMGRPSLIDVEADLTREGLAGVRVGGESVLIGEGRLELPQA